MRLLNTESLELSDPYVPSQVPDYVILSHRWGPDEVTFADITKAPISSLDSQTRTKNGFAKIQGACKLALQDGYEWIWVDSCCIDKSSSAELQEAINSMWSYYAESNICYVYMTDVPDSEAGWGQMFSRSEWFTRGWTLQELIAPVSLEFYAKNWEAIGTKFERHEQIAEITSIDPKVLVRSQAVDLCSTAERLSWAAHRKVTREEDEAYSLLGLFDVNMPLLYGEGRVKAFIRLQEGIYNATAADHSIFLFRYSLHKHSQPLLADSPTRFCDRSDCTSCPLRGVQCLPSRFRYTNVVESERWNTQAHEQIQTTVTMFRNEMSTMLPLLDYRDVSNKLIYLDNDKKPRAHVTHVAVLNHRPEEHEQGAFCLLLRRQPEDLDACTRLQTFPAILPHLGDLESKIRNTKLLICPGPSIPEGNTHVSTIFSVKSAAFDVDTWNAKDDRNHSILSAQAKHDSSFEIQTRKVEIRNGIAQILCRLTGSRVPRLLYTIRLVWVNQIWSLREVYEREHGSTERKSRTLFHSDVLADRCSVKLPDGTGRVSVNLRRLPGSTRTHLEKNMSVVRYQISVRLME